MNENEQLQRDVIIMLNECKRHRDQKEDLLTQINKSIQALQHRKHLKNNAIYEMKKNATYPFKLIECEGEIKGLDSGIYQLKKIKAFLKSYGL